MPITHNIETRTTKAGDTVATLRISIPDTIEEANASIAQIAATLRNAQIGTVAFEPTEGSKGLGLCQLSLENLLVLTNALKNCPTLGSVSLANNRLDLLKPECFSPLTGLLIERKDSLMVLNLVNTGLNALGEAQMNDLCKALEHTSLMFVFIGSNFIDAPRPAIAPTSTDESAKIAALAAKVTADPTIAARATGAFAFKPSEQLVGKYSFKQTADAASESAPAAIASTTASESKTVAASESKAAAASEGRVATNRPQSVSVGASKSTRIAAITTLCDRPQNWQMTPLSCRNAGRLMDSLTIGQPMAVACNKAQAAQLEEKAIVANNVLIEYSGEHSTEFNQFALMYSLLQNLALDVNLGIKQIVNSNGQFIVIVRLIPAQVLEQTNVQADTLVVQSEITARAVATAPAPGAGILSFMARARADAPATQLAPTAASENGQAAAKTEEQQVAPAAGGASAGGDPSGLRRRAPQGK